jgi:hypothetical protein
MRNLLMQIAHNLLRFYAPVSARGAQGIGGMRSSHAAGGAVAIAESRKVRFLALCAKNAPEAGFSVSIFKYSFFIFRAKEGRLICLTEYQNGFTMLTAIKNAGKFD